MFFEVLFSFIFYARAIKPVLTIESFGFVFSKLKMESIRKLSNWWTKTLYQNNLKYIAFFFTLFKSYRCNLLSVITPKTISNGSP